MGTRELHGAWHGIKGVGNWFTASMINLGQHEGVAEHIRCSRQILRLLNGNLFRDISNETNMALTQAE
jgi:hypothetical protein